MIDEGFVDMTEEDVGALINRHSNPLTDEDLLEMTKFASEEENGEEDEEETEKRGLTLENLQQFIQDISDKQKIGFETKTTLETNFCGLSLDLVLVVLVPVLR